MDLGQLVRAAADIFLILIMAVCAIPLTAILIIIIFNILVFIVMIIGIPLGLGFLKGVELCQKIRFPKIKAKEIKKDE